MGNRQSRPTAVAYGRQLPGELKFNAGYGNAAKLPARPQVASTAFGYFFNVTGMTSSVYVTFRLNPAPVFAAVNCNVCTPAVNPSTLT